MKLSAGMTPENSPLVTMRFPNDVTPRGHGFTLLAKLSGGPPTALTGRYRASRPGVATPLTGEPSEKVRRQAGSRQRLRRRSTPSLVLGSPRDVCYILLE